MPSAKKRISVDRRRGQRAKPRAGAKWGDAFRERLRALIKEKYGGVQGRFAAAGGLHATRVSGWLAGKVLPKLDTINVVADATGVSVDWLLTGRGHDGEPCAEPVYRGQSRTKPELEQDVRAAVLARVDPAARPYVSGEDLDVSALLDAARDELREYASEIVSHLDDAGRAEAYRAILMQLIRSAATDGVPEHPSPAWQLAKSHLGGLASLQLLEKPSPWRFVALQDRFNPLSHLLGSARLAHLHEAIRATLSEMGPGAPTLEVNKDGTRSFAYPNRFGGPEPEPGRGVEQAAPIV